MITGPYGASTGAFLEGFVYCRAPVGRALRIAFLVDTGGEYTYVAHNDLLDLGQDSDRLDILSREPVHGVGGMTESRITGASIAFRHDDAGASLFGLGLAVLPDAKHAGLPSMLGRDILFRGDLRLDPAAGRVYFDPPKGSFILNRP